MTFPTTRGVIMFQVWDTAGQEKVPPHPPTHTLLFSRSVPPSVRFHEFFYELYAFHLISPPFPRQFGGLRDGY